MSSRLWVMSIYHIKRLCKNPYYGLWLLLVVASTYGVANYWLSQHQLTANEWILNLTSSGMLGAYLGLPFLVRSFLPAFAATGGIEFLGSRTEYLNYDIMISIILNILTMCLVAMAGIIAASYLLSKPIAVTDLLYPLAVFIVPSLLLLVPIIMTLLVVCQPMVAVIIFWALFIGLGALPGLAPWGGLALLPSYSSSLTPLMLVNRVFYCLAFVLMVYIFTQVVSNQSNGVYKTRLQKTQAKAANYRAVIIAGKGVVLDQNWRTARLIKELKIIGFPRMIISWLTALGCGWLTYYNQSLGLAGIGIAVLWMAVIISPHNFEDYLIPGKQKRKWSFILTRVALNLMLPLFQLLLFGLVSTFTMLTEITVALVMVGGWSSLAAHYWPLLWVKVVSAMFWIAVVIFPGALQMTNASRWWLIIGCFLVFLSLVLYRRHPYLE